MCRIEGNAKVTRVICVSCSHVMEIRQDLDANGREKALLRGELAKHIAATDRIGEEFEEYKRMSDEARTADAGRFAEIALAYASANAKSLRTLEDMSGDLADVQWAIGAMSGHHNPGDLAEIARLEALVRELKAKIDNYYETPNSRRGMPSLYDAEVKKFDQDRPRRAAARCPRPAAARPWGTPAPRIT